MKKEKIFQLPTLSILIFALAIAMSGNARAQVTIGADLEPQDFSVLELISNGNSGLRLPQMTADQRDALSLNTLQGEAAQKARGLTIFNTSTYCVETWNGTKWIEQCMSCEGISFPALGKAYSLCTGTTVADLSAKIGGADIYESAEGGNKRSSGDALSNGATYYAEQRVANCAAPARTPVTVNLGNCTSAPTNANITAFVNVMYDFQHQTLEAYNTGGGIATDYTWQVSTSNSSSDSDFSNILDAPNSAFYTVPAHYADAYPTGTELFFRCIIKNPATAAPQKTGNLGILFIKTNTSGYGIDANGVRYLTLGKGSGGKTVAEGSNATMKVALLNLGQSADWTLAGGYIPNNDAGDLGDFYQWGRIADGHQNVVWKKGTDHRDSIVPFGATPAYTSATVAYSSSTAYDENKQIPSTSTSYYGKFITGSVYWGSTDNSLWGNGTKSYSTRASDISLSDWTYQSNNPCPSGWRVPSRWNFWDLYRGTGSDTSPTSSNYTGTDNTWAWRAMNTANYAIGGVIITATNAFGEEEKLFLPASGYRYDGSGALGNAGTNGYSWSSTYSTVNYACGLYFDSSSVTAGYSSTHKAVGQSVRCVAEF